MFDISVDVKFSSLDQLNQVLHQEYVIESYLYPAALRQALITVKHPHDVNSVRSLAASW